MKKIRFNQYHHYRYFNAEDPFEVFIGVEKREKMHTKPYSRVCYFPEPTKKMKSPPKKTRSPSSFKKKLTSFIEK